MFYDSLISPSAYLNSRFRYSINYNFIGEYVLENVSDYFQHRYQNYF